MEFTRHEDVHEFARIAEPILSEKEDLYSLFFGVLQAIKTGKYEHPFMATIMEKGEVLALLQMTPPHPLNLIFTDESRLEESVDLLIKKLLDLEIEISSVVSLKEWANLFAEKWAMKTDLTSFLVMDQGLYRLDKVNETLEPSLGTWRFANRKDGLMIEKWFNLFEEDSGLSISPMEDVKKRVASFIDEQEIFLWELDGKVVSMMKKSRPTKYGVTVSLVFTPREERKKGYGRTLVAAGTKELLNDYQFCVLYTDLMNATSNKIYMEIGYKRLADSVQLGFERFEK
ncbi:GNAT family N-acetyltransferase [Sporosarcina sp. FA9]|uniref:GNAT family N-acetyltransferase n=1 Tax=Sporosarcina sp. FA9 TaxID=3413030 RepID=UPI003F657F96